MNGQIINDNYSQYSFDFFIYRKLSLQGFSVASAPGRRRGEEGGIDLDLDLLALN